MSSKNGKAVPQSPRGRVSKATKVAIDSETARKWRREAARRSLSCSLAVWVMGLRADTEQLIEEVCRMRHACGDKDNLLFELIDADSLKLLDEAKRDLEDLSVSLTGIQVKCPRPDVHASEAGYRKSYDI